MEPYSLPQLQALLFELQDKLDQTSSNSKRFKLGLKIDKCRAMIERRMPPSATATTATKKTPPPTSSSSSPPLFSSIAPLRPTALELARRASRFERDDEKKQQKRPGDDMTLRDARRRAEACGGGKSSAAAVASAATATASSSSSAPLSAPAAAFGRSEALEKPYLRLTSLPTVADVRPPQVLAEALKLLKKKWRKESSGAGAGAGGGGGEEAAAAAAATAAAARARYASYFRGQLKSVRQDLVVQAVRGPLAIDAYETHARIALEAGDVAEFNQCQSALGELYKEAERREAEEAEAEAGEERRAAAAERRAAAAERRASSAERPASSAERPASSAERRASSASAKRAAEASLCLRNRAEFSSYRILYAAAMAFNASSARSR